MSALNQRLFEIIYMQAHRNGFLNFLAVFFAQYLPYLLAVAFLVLVYYQKGWRRKMYLFCEGALAIVVARGLATELIRYFLPEPRPFAFYSFTPLIGESGSSFPSAHMTWFFSLAMIVWFANHKWGWWFFGLSAVMGLARIYAGVHWPMDVAVGIAVGIACGLAVHWVLAGSRKGLSAPPPTIANG